MTERTFVLPDLGEGLQEAQVLHWLVASGDTVVVDQVVVEVETAKATVEIPIPWAGEVLDLCAASGTTIAVGSPLITVDVGSGANGALTEPSEVAAVEPTDPATVANARAGADHRTEERAGAGNVLVGYGPSETFGGSPTRRLRRRSSHDDGSANDKAVRDATPPDAPARVRVASPLVRRRARALALDLTQLHGTGPGGLIVMSDVEAASQASTSSTRLNPRAGTDSGVQVTELTGLRRQVAQRLSISRREIPEATVWVDVDATALWDTKVTNTAHNTMHAEEGRHDDGRRQPSLLAYLAKFTVLALTRYPIFNSHFDNDTGSLRRFSDIHLGVATDTPSGLLVPVLEDAGSLSTRSLHARIAAAVAEAKAGRASGAPSATFTLNNYGPLGVDGSAAIINPPQVAILGFGRILERPWVVESTVQIRRIMQMSLVFDHRICDGGTAAAFMRAVAGYIENPLTALHDL